MSLLLAVVLFAASPWFAEFYGQPDLVPLTRVSAGMMFLNSFAGVHWTLYTCRRDFKTPALIQGAVAILSMPVCLVLAYMGWSYWAVVVQGGAGILNMVIVWIVSPWKPRFLFSWASFRELFGFGSKLAVSGLLFVLYSNLRTFIVGKFYSPADLGLYSRGMHLVSMVPSTVSGMLDSISYPILATVQNDDERLKSAYRKYICVSTMVLAWAVLLMCAMAEPLVRLMFGADWLGCVPYLQVLALAYALDHVCVINLNLLKVKGRSDLFLRLEIMKRAVSVALIIYAATISVVAICWATVIYGQIAIFINSYYTGKIIRLTWWQQQKDYLPYVLYAALCALPAWGIAQLPVESWFPVAGREGATSFLYYLTLLSQLFVGGTCSALGYFALLSIKRDPALGELRRCAAENPKICRLPVIGTWARKHQ